MGAPVITIRSFDRADIAAVAELEAANQPQPWTVGILRDELRADNRSYVVAEGEDVIGYGGVMVAGDEAHVTNILVVPQYRRQGIGQRLLARLVRNAIALGAKHLTLEVRGDNEAARRLYDSFGLEPVGIRPGYYGGEDALIMWAHDIDTREYARSLN